MSERVFEGAASVRQLPQRGMITLRGDLSSAALQAAATDISTGAFPERGHCDSMGARGIAWMSPDEALVMCPHDVVGTSVASLKSALAGTHHLVQDVSDARVIFAIEGDAARDVVAKLCPVDMRPAQFGPGRFRRTRLAQIPCAFWMRGDGGIELVVFSSVADYAWSVLSNAARADAAVGHFAP
ncbi:MAG: sarcosine oxidase subunit gamma family protein [Pseudomonadota bacterium]